MGENSIDTRFEIYQNQTGEYRGRLVRANGQTVVDSREYSKGQKNEIDASDPARAKSNNDK
jgi:uncharacterized protein YegP (UPF0339 family)